jgi:hypothetical protein
MLSSQRPEGDDGDGVSRYPARTPSISDEGSDRTVTTNPSRTHFQTDQITTFSHRRPQPTRNTKIPANYLYQVIICWRCRQLIANEPVPERRKEVLEMLRRGSILTWQHGNLHGEYDFTDEKMEDSVGLQTPKNLELSLV